MQVVDPVGLGIVASIARPGGNITGFTQGPQILWGKRLDLLSDLIGRRPSRLGWLGNPGNPASASNWADAKEAAHRLGAEIVRAEASQAGEIESAVGFMRDRDALLVQWAGACQPQPPSGCLREPGASPRRRADVLRR